jgi:hypothetical protein
MEPVSTSAPNVLPFNVIAQRPNPKKDDRLIFRVQGRRFKLSSPRFPGGPFYIRFEVPAKLRPQMKGIRFAQWSLETNVVAAAIERAKVLVTETLFGDPRKAVMERARAGYATLRELTEAYQPDPQDVGLKQQKRNVSALLLVVKEGTECRDTEAALDLRTDVLTEKLGRTWQKQRIAAVPAADELAQNRVRWTINSTLAMAKSVLSPKVKECYEDLHLPDFTSFREVPRLAVDEQGGYVPWPAEVQAAVVRDAETRLRFEQPLVYRAYWLMYRLGLRNSEVMWARRNWIAKFQDGTGEFEIRRRTDFKTKNRRYRTIALNQETMLELENLLTGVGPDDFLINDAVMTHREEVCYYELNTWLRKHVGHEREKCAYELRKEAASIIADRPESEGGGIQAAADFLGDTIAVTEKHYRGRKRRVQAVTALEAAPAVALMA